MEKEYAGFWRRLAAHIIDNIIIYIAMYIVAQFMLPEVIDKTSPEEIAKANALAERFSILFFAVSASYEILMTSSEKQATIGKMAVGIKIIDEQGNKITLINAVFRYFGKMLSALLLGIGYIMIAFHPQKRGLHDIIANTYVVKN